MKRLAVLGLGRSGLAVARAATRRGVEVEVFDQESREGIGKPEVLAEADVSGLTVHLGWNGDLPAGFDAAIVNPAIDQRSPVLKRIQEEGIEILSEVEYAWRISDAPIAAITGTNGKSTTTVMAWLALRELGIDAVLCGNIFGSGFPEATLTEAADIATANQVLVAEISSFQLEWVSQFRPRVAAITTIQEDHLNRYDSFEDYRATKLRIFDKIGQGDTAVIKAQDPMVPNPLVGDNLAYVPRGRRRTQIIPEQKRGGRVWTFGALGEDAEVGELGLKLFGKITSWQEFPFQEAHNRVNAATAALVALGAINWDGERDALDAVVAGLKKFTGLAHRMEVVGEKDGIVVINNSMCTNPDALLKSTQAIRGNAHLLVGGVNKGLDFRPLKNYFANRRHHVYLFGRDRVEINSELGGEWPEYETMAEAFAAANQNAAAGETIMLAPGCASSDQFRDFRHRGDVFRDMARSWLDT